MLVHRDKGYSIVYVIRRSLWRYSILIALVLFFSVGCLHTHDPQAKGFCLWAIGMFLGALCRDIGWFRRIKRSWPFTQKITDWKKVEEIAGLKDATNQASQPIVGKPGS